MKRLLILGLATTLAVPLKSLADGCFVAPKFVWDKHKDINEPTQKAIMVYDAGREDLILQVKYEGPVEEFGWLIPVPNRPTVQKGSMKCFYELSQYTQKHFETEWQHNQTKSATLSTPGNAAAGEAEPPVKVVEIKTVGAYEIAVLSTKDSDALAKWLDTNQFYFPTNKADVIDAYVKQQWYFVAARINLSKSSGFQLLSSPRQVQNEPTANYSTHLKLAGGELNPLQISFASDRCVFPLKISSVNGQPSEVQVYVLSPDPLLEKTMLEKKLSWIYSNDLTNAAKRAQSYKNMREMQRNLSAEFGGFVLPTDPEEEKAIEKMAVTPEASSDALLPFAKVTKADLPDSSKLIPRLADKSWWLTKQTWTFKPDEMRDLEFEPAISVFASKLDSKYGYFAAASLIPLVPDTVPVMITALRNSNPVVRINIASVLNDPMHSFSDPRLTETALSSLKDSEPKVRYTAVEILTEYSNWKPKFAELLVPMLRDEDAAVRHGVSFSLPRFRGDLEKYIPYFQQMLKDTNPAVRISGLRILERLNQPVERDDLLPFFKMSDREAISYTLSYLRNETNGFDISAEETVPLLQNPDPFMRMIGLKVLYENAGNQSVELALPLLKDSEQYVRARTAATLRALTGQHFTEEQTAEWEKWWNENKTNFVVELHPEELRPQRRGTNDFWRYLTNRPPASVP